MTSLCSQVCSYKCDEIGISARRKAFEESRSAILGGSTFSPFPSLLRIYTFLSMWPLRIQPWAFTESRRERGRWWWLVQRDEANGNRWKRNADWKSAAAPSAEGASARKLGPGENNTSRGGWRNEDGRQSFSTLRARNMLITFGHRRRRPSGIGLRGILQRRDSCK